MRIATMKRTDNYGMGLIVAVLGLFLLMLITLYKINQSTTLADIPADSAQKAQHGFIVPPIDSRKSLYIASSKATAAFYAKNGSSVNAYSKKIRHFVSFLEEMGYTSQIITMDKIPSLKTDDVLFVVDAQVLNAQNKQDIQHFVQTGGALFFNFLAGFTQEDGTYAGAKFVHDITTLSLSEKGFASFKDGLAITPKILSPFSTYLKAGKLLSVALYDKLPIYKTLPSHNPDFFASSFDQISPPVTKDASKRFSNDEAAVAWHGYAGKGKWIYTSLPSYSFYDIAKNQETYKKLLAGMISFLTKPAMAQLYPYIDQKSAVFISEDTEYKFTNFKRFTDLSQAYKVPVTAFIVADLAKLPEHKEMMSKIKENPFVEFASHSSTHKKIVGESEAFIVNETENSKKVIDPLAPLPIVGFRPPREELNLLMKQHLAKSGFAYVLGAADSYLYPRVDKEEDRLIYIPRHGTDDYSYLVNLDWDQNAIAKQMHEEADFVTGLNGIYTLSVHTHLFSYSSNIEIIRSFYEHLQTHPELKPLNGRALVRRVLAQLQIQQGVTYKGNQMIVTLKNNAAEDVKNVHIQIFKNPKQKILQGAASEGVHVTLFEQEDAIMIDKLPANGTVSVYLTLGE